MTETILTVFFLRHGVDLCMNIKTKICLNFWSLNFKVIAVIAVQKHEFFK